MHILENLTEMQTHVEIKRQIIRTLCKLLLTFHFS